MANTKIEQRYIDEHPESMSRYHTSKNLFPNGVTHDARRLSPFPMYVTHAKGSHKWDVEGNKIIDVQEDLDGTITAQIDLMPQSICTLQKKGTYIKAFSELASSF